MRLSEALVRLKEADDDSIDLLQSRVSVSLNIIGIGENLISCDFKVFKDLVNRDNDLLVKKINDRIGDRFKKCCKLLKLPYVRTEVSSGGSYVTWKRKWGNNSNSFSVVEINDLNKGIDALAKRVENQLKDYYVKYHRMPELRRRMEQKYWSKEVKDVGNPKPGEPTSIRFEIKQNDVWINMTFPEGTNDSVAKKFLDGFGKRNDMEFEKIKVRNGKVEAIVL